MTPTKWIIFGIICVIVIAGLAFFSTRDRVNVDELDEYSIITEEPIADHVKGTDDSDVVLIEYGDFQCPGCASAYPTIKQLVEHYEYEMALVYRNFPLTNIHPNALAAATAAEAAGLQGEYFAMHDILFEQQNSWSDAGSDQRTDIFREYAESIGIDGDQFINDFTNDAIAEKIRRDQALGRKSGVDSTPMFFLNGELVDRDTWNDAAKFETTIRDALKDAGVSDLPERLNEGE